MNISKTYKAILWGLLGVLVIYIVGYTNGKANIKIVHDTTQVVDTVQIVDTAYMPAKVDTIYINNLPYKTYFSERALQRNGYAKVWFIDSLKFFKWQIKSPDPIVITNVRIEKVNVPTIDWRVTAGVGVIGIIAGFIGGLKWK